MLSASDVMAAAAQVRGSPAALGKRVYHDLVKHYLAEQRPGGRDEFEFDQSGRTGRIDAYWPESNVFIELDSSPRPRSVWKLLAARHRFAGTPVWVLMDLGPIQRRKLQQILAEQDPQGHIKVFALDTAKGYAQAWVPLPESEKAL